MKFLIILLGLALSIEGSATSANHLQCNDIFAEASHLNPRFSKRWYKYSPEHDLVGLEVTLKFIVKNTTEPIYTDSRSFGERLSAFLPELVMGAISGSGPRIEKNVIVNELGQKIKVSQLRPDYSGIIVAQSKDRIIMRDNSSTRSRSHYTIFDNQGGISVYSDSGGFRYEDLSRNKRSSLLVRVESDKIPGADFDAYLTKFLNFQRP